MKIFTTLALIAPVVCFSADLTTVTGKTYKNYSVRRVTEKGIQIMHAQGISPYSSQGQMLQGRSFY